MDLLYRMHTREDEPALVRLWAKYGGGGDAPLESWRSRFMSSPLGETVIALAVDRATGELAGHMLFVPCLVSVEGSEIPGYRACAVVLSDTARRVFVTRGKHPLLRLYNCGREALRSRGAGIIYMLPDPRLQRFRFSSHIHLATFPMWSQTLPLESRPLLPEGFDVADTDGSDPRLDTVWKASTSHCPCSLVHDSRTMPWKISLYRMNALGIFSDGEMKGFVTSRPKGDGQWEICDVVTADLGPSLEATLAAACRQAEDKARQARERFNADPLKKVTILATPNLQPALAKLGFAADPSNYQFVLTVDILDESLPVEKVAPHRWHLGAAD